jgi:hypothetical protein
MATLGTETPSARQFLYCQRHAPSPLQPIGRVGSVDKPDICVNLKGSGHSGADVTYRIGYRLH